jgi:hypothetical protein
VIAVLVQETFAAITGAMPFHCYAIVFSGEERRPLGCLFLREVAREQPRATEDWI